MVITGTVAWDCWCLVFFMNRYCLIPRFTNPKIFPKLFSFSRSNSHRKGFFRSKFPCNDTRKLKNIWVSLPGCLKTSGYCYPDILKIRVMIPRHVKKRFIYFDKYRGICTALVYDFKAKQMGSSEDHIFVNNFPKTKIFLQIFYDVNLGTINYWFMQKAWNKKSHDTVPLISELVIILICQLKHFPRCLTP